LKKRQTKHKSNPSSIKMFLVLNSSRLSKVTGNSKNAMVMIPASVDFARIET
jgi:hypothetical protein